MFIVFCVFFAFVAFIMFFIFFVFFVFITLFAFFMSFVLFTKETRKRKLDERVKLDMSKAFDRVEWSFIDTMMQKLGFDDRWQRIISDCISTPTYSSNINKSIVGHVSPGRGLYQGCRLSRYLFLICAKGLSSLISKAASEVNHLSFADDSFLFFRAKRDNIEILMKVLDTYAVASGQVVNFQNSAIDFIPNVDEELKALLSSMLSPLPSPTIPTSVSLPSFVKFERSPFRMYGTKFDPTFLSGRVACSHKPAGKLSLKLSLLPSPFVP